MTFGSVRLLHAHPVPHTYIANQVYDPIDEDHKRSGSFLILLEHRNSTEGSFLASLVNILIRDYYRLPGADRVSCFEKALIHMNEHIKQYTKNHDDSLELHGTIVLVHNDEIHITTAGKPAAFLVRQATPLRLIEETPAETSPVPSFSVITSGEVQGDDILTLISGVTSPESLEDDITFAIQQPPLYESARAFARIAKQKSWNTIEALFIHFGDHDPQTYQVYIDRSLESPGEKMAGIQSFLSTQLHFIGEGILYVGNRILSIRSRPKVKYPIVTTPEETEFTTETVAPSLTKEEKVEITEAIESTVDEANNAPTITTDESFHVTAYWDQPAAPATDDLPLPAHAYEPDDKPQSSFHSRISQISLKHRTTYLLIGSFVLLVLIIQVVNSTTSKNNQPVPSTAERDAIISQAEDARRQAIASQAQDDITQAVDNLLIGIEALTKIPAGSETETSKSLKLQMQESLAALTKTTALTSPTNSQALTFQPHSLIATTNGVYAFTEKGQAKHYTDQGIQDITSLPKDVTILDSVAYSQKQKIAFLTESADKTLQVYGLTAVDDKLTQLTRSDTKPWPESRILTSFESNLYFVGTTMSKGTAQGDSYRIAPYANNSDTSYITELINNGFAFYGIDKGNQIVRLAANTNKTPVNVSGMPERFLPKAFTLLPSPQEGTLYLFDVTGQRILAVSTEGAYRKQYQLPTGTNFSKCESTDKTFVCVTTDNTIVTLSIPTP